MIKPATAIIISILVFFGAVQSLFVLAVEANQLQVQEATAEQAKANPQAEYMACVGTGFGYSGCLLPANIDINEIKKLF